MSITDDLAARLNAASAEDKQAYVEDFNRMVSTNAVLATMTLHGRDRFVLEDSKMAGAIHRILMHAEPANTHKDDIGLVPSAQVLPNKVVEQVSKVTAIAPAGFALNNGQGGEQQPGEAA